ncbi:MAG: amidohydrolase family protein [Gemmatimonadaceae bacterium]
MNSTIAIRDVTVIPMTGSTSLSHKTVFVQNGRIARIAESTAAIDVGTTVLDGSDRFLMPGLIDAHVHLRKADAPQYVLDGVLTVRNMWGHSGIRPLIEEIKRGVVVGPIAMSLSPGIDGNPPQWPETQLLTNASGADTLVRRLVQDGWTTLKVYQSLSLESFDAVAAAAKNNHVLFAGHVPTAVPIQHALQSGMKSIEHLSGYDRQLSASHNVGTWGWADANFDSAKELVAKTVASGVWNVPTLSIYRTIAQQHAGEMRERVIENRRRFTRMLYEAGAHIAAGTDAGIDVIPAQGALLGELFELEAAGLSREQALSAATRDAGALLGIPQLGTIVVGAPARLLLLDSDPTKDLRALRSIRMAINADRIYKMPSGCASTAASIAVPAGNVNSRELLISRGATNVLELKCAATTPSATQKTVAGVYDTKVSLSSGTCSLPVQDNPTVVQELSNGTVVTLAHAGTTYGGGLKPDKSFVTQIKDVSSGSDIYKIGVSGAFHGDTLRATVTLDYGTSPVCHVIVKWNGVRRE